MDLARRHEIEGWVKASHTVGLSALSREEKVLAISFLLCSQHWGADVALLQSVIGADAVLNGIAKLIELLRHRYDPSDQASQRVFNSIWSQLAVTHSRSQDRLDWVMCHVWSNLSYYFGKVGHEGYLESATKGSYRDLIHFFVPLNHFSLLVFECLFNASDMGWVRDGGDPDQVVQISKTILDCGVYGVIRRGLQTRGGVGGGKETPVAIKSVELDTDWFKGRLARRIKRHNMQQLMPSYLFSEWMGHYFSHDHLLPIHGIRVYKKMVGQDRVLSKAKLLLPHCEMHADDYFNRYPSHFLGHIKGVLDAVAYLHSLGWAHTDIKLGNILYDATVDKLKLADFDSLRVGDGLVNRYAKHSTYCSPFITAYDGTWQQLDVFNLALILCFAWDSGVDYSVFSHTRTVPMTPGGFFNWLDQLPAHVSFLRPALMACDHFPYTIQQLIGDWQKGMAMRRTPSLSGSDRDSVSTTVGYFSGRPSEGELSVASDGDKMRVAVQLNPVPCVAWVPPSIPIGTTSPAPQPAPPPFLPSWPPLSDVSSVVPAGAVSFAPWQPVEMGIAPPAPPALLPSWLPPSTVMPPGPPPLAWGTQLGASVTPAGPVSFAPWQPVGGGYAPPAPPALLSSWQPPGVAPPAPPALLPSWLPPSTVMPPGPPPLAWGTQLGASLPPLGRCHLPRGSLWGWGLRRLPLCGGEWGWFSLMGSG